MRFLNIVLSLSFFVVNTAFAGLTNRPDGHSPIGVMGDHAHHKDEVMLSYRLMLMQMQGLQKGGETISSSEVFSSSSFMMAPKKMDMWMHMLGAMYGITDQITLMAMLPYTSNDMTMNRKMPTGATMKSDSQGIGDISLTGLFTLKTSKNYRLLTSLGFFLPTGSTNKEKNSNRLGYPMQMGSGSFALKPNLTYSQYWPRFSFGSQAGLKYFVNDNSNDYRRGSQYFINLWGAYKLNKNLSTSVRLKHKSTDPIKGSDSSINAMMSPSQRADFQHGHTGIIFIGANLLGQSFAHGHRLSIELGTPIYQNLNGIQMQTDLISQIGWQKAF